MSSIVSNAGWAKVLAAVTGQATVNSATAYMSLHTASPGTSDSAAFANELSTSVGSPAYARQSCAFNAPSTGSITNSGTVVFNVPTSTTVTNWGLWDSATLHSGTDYLMGGSLSASATFNAQGTLTFNANTGLTISGN